MPNHTQVLRPISVQGGFWVLGVGLRVVKDVYLRYPFTIMITHRVYDHNFLLLQPRCPGVVLPGTQKLHPSRQGAAKVALPNSDGYIPL